MLRIDKELLRWEAKRVWRLNTIFLGIGGLATLMISAPLGDSEFPMLGFVFVYFHCLALARVSGGHMTRQYHIYRMRGYSRNQLWGHYLLVTAGSALLVWGVISLSIVSGFRSFYQQTMEGTPLYPMMARRDWGVIFPLLVAYVLILPVATYEWTRYGAPVHGRAVGRWLMAGVFFFGMFMMTLSVEGRSLLGVWHVWLSLGALAIISGTALFGSWWGFQNWEVRS